MLEHVLFKMTAIDFPSIPLAFYIIITRFSVWRLGVHNRVPSALIPLFFPTQSFSLIDSLNCFKVCPDCSHAA